MLVYCYGFFFNFCSIAYFEIEYCNTPQVLILLVMFINVFYKLLFFHTNIYLLFPLVLWITLFGNFLQTSLSLWITFHDISILTILLIYESMISYYYLEPSSVSICRIYLWILLRRYFYLSLCILLENFRSYYKWDCFPDIFQTIIDLEKDHLLSMLILYAASLFKVVYMI